MSVPDAEKTAHEEGVQRRNGGAKSTRKAECVCVARDCFADCSPLTLEMWRLVGLGMLMTFSASYYIVPSITLLLPVWVLRSHLSLASVLSLAIWLTLAFCPNYQVLKLSFSRLYRSCGLYFDAEIWLETSREKLIEHPKPIIHLFVPHGVISYGGWCFGSLFEGRPFKVATAHVLLHMPILRQILGQFGMCDGSRSSLRHTLKDQKTDVSLYPGGLAELFLCNPEHEALFFDHRKGCIKLAMESGADITVTYLFGNTLQHKLFLSGLAAKLSRATRISFTVFWGRWFTPIPFQTKVISVTSDILSMPDMSSRSQDITPEVIASHHARVKAEITRLFETYKHKHPMYAEKSLTYV